MNRPHSREKRVVDRKVNVSKKPVNSKEKVNTVLDFLRKVIKK